MEELKTSVSPQYSSHLQQPPPPLHSSLFQFSATSPPVVCADQLDLQKSSLVDTSLQSFTPTFIDGVAQAPSDKDMELGTPRRKGKRSESDGEFLGMKSAMYGEVTEVNQDYCVSDFQSDPEEADDPGDLGLLCVDGNATRCERYDRYSDTSGSTIFCGIFQGVSIFMASEGRLINKSLGQLNRSVVTDDEDKFHMITPNIYALSAGNWGITGAVLKNLKEYRRDSSISIHEAAELVRTELHNSCKKAKERTKEESWHFLTGVFFIVGFDSGIPILYDVREYYEEARRVPDGIGAGNGWTFTPFLIRENISGASEITMTNHIGRSMVRACLRDSRSGGIMCIRLIKRTGLRLLHKEHVLASYNRYYNSFKEVDEKAVLFLVCGCDTTSSYIQGYFTDVFKEELEVNHVLGWPIGSMRERTQFRRIEFFNEVAGDIYAKLKSMTSTVVMQTNGVERLKVCTQINEEITPEGEKNEGKEEITPEGEKNKAKEEITPEGEKNKAKEFLVMQASKESLNYICSDGFGVLLPLKATNG